MEGKMTAEEERALIAEFGVVCACDGAMDDGCPRCTKPKREEWLAKRRAADRLRWYGPRRRIKVLLTDDGLIAGAVAVQDE